MTREEFELNLSNAPFNNRALLDHDAAQREEIARLTKEKDKWAELAGSFTASQHRYLRDMEQLKKEIADLQDKYEGAKLLKDSTAKAYEQLQSDLDHAKGAVQRFVRGEDKLCLVCGAKEPCELKDDPASPCMFEPTPMELVKECQRLRKDLDQVMGEAIRFADYLDALPGSGGIDESVMIFLTSPLVHAYRARQGKERDSGRTHS